MLLTLILAFCLVSCGDSKTSEKNHSEALQYEPMNKELKTAEITSIGDCADTDIVIPAYYMEYKIIRIGHCAFQYNEDIISVTIPNTVTYIERSAFAGCKKLKKVTISSNVHTIDSHAFEGCESLVSVSLPPNLETLSAYVFYECKNLTSVKIQDELTKIRPYAFFGCEKLKSITLPASITCIDDFAFMNCKSLKSIKFAGTMKQWNSISFGSDWNLNVPAKEVVCSNGTIKLK